MLRLIRVGEADEAPAEPRRVEVQFEGRPLEGVHCLFTLTVQDEPTDEALLRACRGVLSEAIASLQRSQPKP